MANRVMIDSYQQYERVYNRPRGMTVRTAIREYMGFPPSGKTFEVRNAKARYYYHTRQPYFLNWMNGVKTPEKATAIVTVSSAPTLVPVPGQTIKPSMRRNFAQHLRILVRPQGVPIRDALFQENLTPRNDAYACHIAYGNYRRWLGKWSDYYGTNPKGLREFAMTGNLQFPGENFVVLHDETQYCDDCQPICEECEEPVDVEEEIGMRVGDTVIASFNHGDRGIDDMRREVVQVKFIDGEQACVKTLEGDLKIYNQKNLKAIPKSF